MREPSFSFWGEIQSCDTLYPGIYLVTTPGHGGIIVEPTAALYLSSYARKCGFRDGGYLCFEEDCCEQVVLRELLDRGMWRLPERIKDKEGFEKEINRTIEKHHPDYWRARAAGKTAPRPITCSRQRKEAPTR